jgi:hypothetical protein
MRLLANLSTTIKYKLDSVSQRVEVTRGPAPAVLVCGIMGRDFTLQEGRCLAI